MRRCSPWQGRRPFPTDCVLPWRIWAALNPQNKVKRGTNILRKSLLPMAIRKVIIDLGTSSMKATAFILAVIIAASLTGIWLYQDDAPEVRASSLLEERLDHLADGDDTLSVFLQNLVTQIKVKKRPLEDFDGTLRTALGRFQDIRGDLADISTGDPSTGELKRQAIALLDSGKLASVENVLNEASDRELEAPYQKPLDHERRLLAAAAFQAVNADLKATQLAHTDAAKYYRRAAGIIPDNNKLMLARYLHDQGAAYRKAGLYPQAEKPLAQALSIRRRILGSEHPSVAVSLQQLALLRTALGQYDQAETLLAQAISIRETSEESDRLANVANLNLLSSLRARLAHHEAAVSLAQRVLTLREDELGSKHPDVATSLTKLATLYTNTCAYLKAKPLLQHALTIREETLGPNHPDVADSLNRLAELYTILGHYTESEPLFVRALKINANTLGLDHPNAATVLHGLARLQIAQGQYAEAERHLSKALLITQNVTGRDHPNVATTLNSLVWLYTLQGQFAKAEPLIHSALATREKALGPTHPDVVSSLNNAAMLYHHLGRFQAS